MHKIAQRHNFIFSNGKDWPIGDFMLEPENNS